uniref:Uncharacterized protein n=1 Tax=Trypanosoma congolense (strain IL3000) TaxID=1068625 RepID=G0UVA5_TRYCI|nr:conserved hypothetical protein [Trypanosoma congolense IL3000]
MSSGIRTREGSAVVPPRHTTLQPQQQQPEPQSDSNDDQVYLHRHLVPSKVENLFSSVLNERPEDPLQYIVQQLRSTTGSSTISSSVNSSGRVPVWEPKRDSVTSSVPSMCKEPITSTVVCTPSTRNMLLVGGLSIEPLHRGSNNLTSTEEPPIGSDNVVANPSGKNAMENVVNPTPSVEPRGASLADATHAMAPNGVVTPPSSATTQEMPNAFTFGSGRARTPTTPMLPDVSFTARRASSGGTRPVLNMARPSSKGSGRNEAAHCPSGIRFGVMGDVPCGGTMSSTLDRDESTRSDLSAFSVASMDLQDFLQEFRSAKADCIGADTKMVDINALSDILQNVNIPLPDIPLIADLFDDVKRVGMLRYDTGGLQGDGDEADSLLKLPTGSAAGSALESKAMEFINFEAFLARMAFMIQGRYPMEVLRGTFYSLIDSAQQKCTADGFTRSSPSLGSPSLPQQQQKSCAEDIKNTNTVCGGVSARPYRVAVKSVCRNSNTTGFSGSTSSNPHASPTIFPSTAAYAINCSAIEPAAESPILISGVPLYACVEEGLWRGLGLPATRAEVECALHALGIPADGNYKCHVNDFVRLATALTSGGTSALSCEGLSPWRHTVFGREN